MQRMPRGFSPSGDFLHRRAAPGVDLFLHPTARFKSVLVRLCLMQPLSERGASALSLAGSVLKQGTAAHPGRAALYGALDSLYGADLAMDTGRLGEAHVLDVELELPADRFTGDPQGLAQALGLLGEVLGAPLKEGKGFPRALVRQERRNLKDAIAAVRNHRPSWATLRCLQIACAGEPYRVGRFGTPDALDRLDPEALWAFWQAAIRRLPLAVYAVGAFEPAAMAERLEGLVLPLRKGKPAPAPDPGFLRAKPARPAVVTETAALSQTRLCLAFRTNTAWKDPDFSALVLAATVLGGGSQAKLFREVREKASLAYDAYASLEKSKGLMLLTAGVDHKERQRAEDLILAQVAAVQAGRISRAEWADSRRTLLNQVRTTGAAPGRLVGMHLEGWVNGASRGVAEVLRRGRAATPEQAARAAGRWAHAATFRLTGEKRERR